MIRMGAFRRFGLVIVACGLCAACDATLSPEEYSDPSIPIRVSVNDRPVLRLESNASTGYQWELAQPLDERVVRLEDSRYVGDPRPLPGSGGVEYWTFKAVGRGTATIPMRYARPWEETAGATRDFQIEVD